MKYWDEFQTKFGFGDGDSLPPDAEACRHVYVREINKLAKAGKSKMRLLAYDRGGCHSPFLILCVNASLVKNVEPRKLCTGEWVPKRSNFAVVQPDAVMCMAIDKAHDLDLDGKVTSKVTIND